MKTTDEDDITLIREIPFNEKGGYTVDIWSDGRIDLPVNHLTYDEAVRMISVLQSAIETMRATKSIV